MTSWGTPPLPSRHLGDLPPLHSAENRVTLFHEGHAFIFQYNDVDRDLAAETVLNQMRNGQLCPYAAGMLTFLILSVGEEEKTD
jgi:hypothetical protein